MAATVHGWPGGLCRYARTLGRRPRVSCLSAPSPVPDAAQRTRRHLTQMDNRLRAKCVCGRGRRDTRATRRAGLRQAWSWDSGLTAPRRRRCSASRLCCQASYNAEAVERVASEWSGELSARPWPTIAPLLEPLFRGRARMGQPGQVLSHRRIDHRLWTGLCDSLRRKRQSRSRIGARYSWPPVARTRRRSRER